jgi:hypothetical protein
MEPGSSLPCSQQPAQFTYPKPDSSYYFCKINLNIYPSIYG